MCHFCVLVFEFVRLVDNQVLPLDLLEGIHADYEAFIGSDAHVELARYQLLLNDLISKLHLRVKMHDIHERCPFLEFLNPVRDRRLRRDDQMRSIILLKLVHISEYRDGLDGFTETL